MLVVPVIDLQHTEWRVIIVTACITTTIGAAIGSVSAFGLDVLKNSRSDKRKLRRMQNAIYAELIRVYDDITLVVSSERAASDENKESLKGYITSMRLDAYDCAKRQAELFYELKEAYSLDELYATILRINPASSCDEVVDRCHSFLDAFYNLIVQTILDPIILKRISLRTFTTISEEAKSYLQQAKRSTRMQS